MKHDVREIFTAALRSGAFKQGHYRLRSLEDRFCCLGVLCELYRLETGRGEWVNGTFIDETGDSSQFAIPAGVRAWAGVTYELDLTLTRDEVGLGGGHHLANAIALNDAGRSFREIADWIEASARKETP